jgi:hypothetical protein
MPKSPKPQPQPKQIKPAWPHPLTGKKPPRVNTPKTGGGKGK